MSYAKLRGRIKEYFGSNESFANKMGMDTSTLSQKLNNKSSWKREEIEKACNILCIDIREVYLYFFTAKVEKLQHDDVKGKEEGE